MSRRDDYPPGAPCWVDTFQPDPEAAIRFYAGLLGWTFDDPAPTAYRSARVRGGLVAGIGQAPATMAAAVWSTYVRVERIEDAVARAEAAGGRALLQPVDAAADGRFAILADVSGVAFGVWEAGARKGAELVNEPGAWAMGALHTPDEGAAETFYGAVFGWRLDDAPGAPVGFWRLPGYVRDDAQPPMPPDAIAVLSLAEDAGVPPHWAVNFAVEDVDRVARTARDTSGTIVMAPVDTPGFRSAVIADPQGGVIAVSAPS